MGVVGEESLLIAEVVVVSEDVTGGVDSIAVGPQLTAPRSWFACSLRAMKVTISVKDRSVFSSPMRALNMSSSTFSALTGQLCTHTVEPNPLE